MGCTIGNDMSSSDIEGENMLYLEAKDTVRITISGVGTLEGPVGVV